jgi:serine/threonine protein kinase
MSEITLLLQGLAAAISSVGQWITLYGWLAATIRKRGQAKKADEINKWLEQLGAYTEPAVRQIVEGWPNAHISPSQREELTSLLVNLTRGARLITTNGLPRSSYVRCEKLIEQLLADVQTCCKTGETYGTGWRLERYVGKGAFGEVWLARNKDFPKPRAFKFFTRPDAKEGIRKEKDNLSHILTVLGDKPNIIEFVDVAVEDERPYLVLEYVGGRSLEDWMLEDRTHRVPLDKYEIIRGIVQGLAEAHRQQICHRDLKPANVLLTDGPRPQPKIADFGLAKIGGQAPATQSAQVSQAVQVGTSMYLPPEAQEVLVARAPAQDDVFALGVLWYQLIVERLERPPYDFADCLHDYQLDSHTIQLIGRCLAQPARRFRDACALAEELDDAVAPAWTPPPGMFDVQPIVSEYVGSLAR